MSYFTTLKKQHKKQINSILEEKSNNISLLRVVGNEYIGYFIYNGDVLVIDTNAKPYESAKVFVRINGKESIKIYRQIGDYGYLQTSISVILPEIMGDLRYEIIGVITQVIHISNQGLTN
jgi:SOS-response transcriptional repressor LexA